MRNKQLYTVEIKLDEWVIVCYCGSSAEAKSVLRYCQERSEWKHRTGKISRWAAPKKIVAYFDKMKNEKR